MNPGKPIPAAPAALDLRNHMLLPEAIDSPRRTFASAAAGRVSYYADTSGSGTPLVLVHSINAAPSAFEMRPLFERFCGHRPVYAPDLPGFGFSERRDRRYTPELFASALGEFVEKVVGTPVDLAAFSLSCEFAARAARADLEHFRSLVFISPTGFSDRALPSLDLGRKVHKGLSLPGLSQGLFGMLTSRPSIRYFLGQAFVGETPSELIDYAYATAHQPGARYAPLYFLSGQLFTRDARQTLYAGLIQPVLVLYDRDPNIDFDQLPHFVASHENWRAERISPSLGLPHWEKPTETSAAMAEFWAGCSET
jgi:pimeloyl-ACP methyl ester carboxylesterase